MRREYTAFFLGLSESRRDYNLLVLDEVISACNHGAVPEETLVSFSKKNAPKAAEIALTVLNPSQTLCNYADYITEMKKQKHHFDRSIIARERIAF